MPGDRQIRRAHCCFGMLDVGGVQDEFTAQAQLFVRSAIGIGVWRVVFWGCWLWLCHWDLRLWLLLRSCVFVTSLS